MKPKSLAFRPYREGRKQVEKIYKKPFDYEVAGELIDVLYWVRWPTYDFIFGVPNRKSKLREVEAGFFQYRSVKKKKVVSGFYVDKKELEELIKGFAKIRKYKP